MRKWLFFAWLCFLPTICAGQDPEFRLPDGFSIEVLVDGLANARAMALGGQGTLVVSTRRAGKLYAVRDAFGDSPEVVTFAENMRFPTGVAMHDGDLYVADLHTVVRYPDFEARLPEPGDPEIIDASLPFENKLHAWKHIAVGPDGKLYVALGAPCNICESPELTVMLRMNRDGSDREPFAHGIRNSVGMDWHPETGELWFTDNGRDMLGDDLPPCELNRVTRPGQHFGFPYCHGADIADPEFGDKGSCGESVPPAQALAPHSAPLGMAFYTGDMFPETYRNQIFIAEHGSWNRSKSAGKTGYRVTLVRLENSRAVAYEPFLEGFLDGEDNVRGRPVDVLVAPDGALLVTDDQRGMVYRISYGNSRQALVR